MEAPLIRCDNQGALAIVSTGIVKQRTKEINACYHNSRNLHACGIVEYAYIRTDENAAYENAAELLTKPLAAQKHQRLHGGSRPSPLLKGFLGFIHFIHFFFMYGLANPYQATAALFSS